MIKLRYEEWTNSSVSLSKKIYEINVLLPRVKRNGDINYATQTLVLS